jgi:D-apionolactonase
VISVTPIPDIDLTGPLLAKVGAVSVVVADGDLRALCLNGTEVLRRLSYPVRNASWGTLTASTMSQSMDQSTDALTYCRQFRAADGSFTGRFDLHIVALPKASTVTATVEITALRPLSVNRAGFTLLHPLAGVAGTAVTIRHPDGPATATTFPHNISPNQTARDMAGLTYQIGAISVDIDLEGEVFEMEDQRNWSDASFKTYCRPLAAQKPFSIQPGKPLRQKVVIHLASKATFAAPPKIASATTARMPQIALAHEPGLSDARLLSGMPVLARLTDCSSDPDLTALSDAAHLTLELVAADVPALQTLAQRCQNTGLHPSHVIALPNGYLASHQPEGPWPTGATPDDFAAALRGLFPDAAVGGGSLTNFTEFNRRPPALAGIDFVTFGNTAIVHAADDMSVFETLEALPHIFASARVLAGDKPQRLGLMSIGMRSNPYGADVVANPQQEKLPMARHDPRQGTSFAAAYGVGVLAAAALGGIESLALAMPDGPLGMAGPTPLGQVILAAAKLAGQQVRIANGEGWVSITGYAGGIAANFETMARDIPGLGFVAPQSAIVFGEVAP